MVAGDSAARLGGPLAGFVPGSRVAGYLLEQLVGWGGMAVVFRARDERLGRVVALKLLGGDEALRERFAEEALAAAAVDHPHIIPVYAAGEADGHPYIAMRFVAGDDLNSLIRREGRLAARRAAAFISPVASALDAAHDSGLVHRDVKPANILVDAQPGRPEHPYLSDFGVARRLRSTSGLTVPGMFLGTPDYAAPEQASGRPVDGRADQYALACVAYELLSGSVPFRRAEAMQVLSAHMFDQPPPLTSVRADLPAAVDRVLARALAKMPNRRYDSCGTFADALRDALDVEPYDTRRGLGMSTVEAPALGPWTAVVTADRDYYESVRADGTDAETAASIGFPSDIEERRFTLSGAEGTELRVGRRSRSLKIEPEIDLAGPPLDPGVSRLHAMLIARPGGNWSVADLSANGIQVNGMDVPPGGTVPLHLGDRIHLGMWTMITMTRD
jgi:serine/threonine protein kinase